MDSRRTGRRRGRAARAAGDVAELLRNLSDDHWLGAHPYARENAVALRSDALLAVDRLRNQRDNGDRLYAIVTRCDLGGELHKTLVAELGLSRRQFYRDLAHARSLIDRDLRAAAGRAHKDSPAPAPSDDARFKTAVVLSAGGHGKAAVAHFATAVDAFDGLAAIWGHCALASLWLDDGDPVSAAHELRAAAERCGAGNGLGADILALARAKLDQQTGRAPHAVRALEGLVARLESRPNDRSQLAADTLGEALALLAFCRHERGDFAAAARLNAKNPAAGDGARVSPFARRYYLNVNAMLSCDGREGPAAARQTCDAFYRFAVTNGFLDDISAALLQLAGIARFERRLDDAQRLARESLSIQQTVGGSDAPILGMLAGIAIDGGAYERAIELARDTRERAPAGSHVWWGAQLHQAEALACSGRHEPALEICRRAARESDRDSRLAAWRRRIEATIFKARGDDDAAFRAAGSSLEILGRDAPPFHRLKSLLVAADARPNRSQRAEIRSLRAVLGWSDTPA